MSCGQQANWQIQSSSPLDPCDEVVDHVVHIGSHWFTMFHVSLHCYYTLPSATHIAPFCSLFAWPNFRSLSGAGMSRVTMTVDKWTLELDLTGFDSRNPVQEFPRNLRLRGLIRAGADEVNGGIEKI